MEREHVEYRDFVQRHFNVKCRPNSDVWNLFVTPEHTFNLGVCSDIVEPEKEKLLFVPATDLVMNKCAVQHKFPVIFLHDPFGKELVKDGDREFSRWSVSRQVDPIAYSFAIADWNVHFLEFFSVHGRQREHAANAVLQ